jgi:small subunit ribosomal protein S27Ae
MIMKKIEFFKVDGNKITRNRRHCPKCGPGVFIAEHKDRFSCGKCGYTEFKGGFKKESKEKPSNFESAEKIKEKQPLPEVADRGSTVESSKEKLSEENTVEE